MPGHVPERVSSRKGVAAVRARQLLFPQPGVVAIHEEELRPPGPGEVLLEAICSLISTGTELTAFTGQFPPDSAWARYVRYPFRPGYSLVGRVVAVGDGVDAVRPGEVAMAQAPHASAALVPARELQPIPPRVSPEEASLLALARIALNGVRLARIELGESVAVAGCGLVGLLAARFCRLSGALTVLAVDVSPQRLQAALHLGCATHTAVAGDEAVAAVRSLTRGQGVDCALEVTGSPDALPSVLKWVRRQGRVILLGSPRGPTQVDFHDEVHTLGLVLIGAHASTHPPVETPGQPWTRRRNGEVFLQLVTSGEILAREFITHRFSWDRASEAYTFLRDDRTRSLGVLLEW